MLELIKKYVTDKADAEGVVAEQVVFQRSQIRAYTSWSFAQVRNNFRTLADYEYIQLIKARRRGDADFNRIDIPEAERGVWRAEEEFISAIRGNEVVTYTDFVHGVRYMEFTEAVHRSIREQRTVAVPFQ